MAASSQKLIKVCGSGSRFPCCLLLALSWNTNENQAKRQKTNENPSTDKLSRAINYGNDKGCHETKLNPKKQQLSIKGAFMIIFHRVPQESRKHIEGHV